MLCVVAKVINRGYDCANLRRGHILQKNLRRTSVPLPVMALPPTVVRSYPYLLDPAGIPAVVPAILPNTEPDTRPVPPG